MSVLFAGVVRVYVDEAQLRRIQLASQPRRALPEKTAWWRFFLVGEGEDNPPR